MVKKKVKRKVKKTLKGLGNPLVVAAAAQKAQQIIVKNKKPILIGVLGIAAIIGGGAIIKTIQRKKAQESTEAGNAYAVYSIINHKLPFTMLDIIRKPQELIMQLISPIQAVKSLYNEVFDTQEKMYNELTKIKPVSILDMQNAYHGLFSRDMMEDLTQTIGVEYYQKAMSAWSVTDKKATMIRNNYTVDSNKITVIDPESKKEVTYQSGWNADLENVYAVTNSAAKIHVVNLANGKLILTPYQVKTNRYLGKTQEFTSATAVIRGGTVFFSSNNEKSVYLYSGQQWLVAPVKNLRFFANKSEFSQYCTKNKTLKAELR